MQPSKMLLAACLLLSTAPALAARSDWRQMTVGHFHLYSTLRDSKTREVARQLQAFEKTVGEFIQSEDRLPDVPTLIYILGSGDFLRYGSGRPGLAGVFYERPYANIIVINGDIDFDFVKVTVFHEYTHFVQRNSRTQRLPPWYVEGFAELCSGFKIDKNQITVGGLPAGIGIDLNSSRWIPVARLLAVKQSDPEYRAERLAAQFYGESWALVHLLLFDDKSLLRPTADYIDNLDVGVLEPDAFRQAFPFDKDGLNLAVRKLIEHQVIHVKRITYANDVAVDDAPISAITPAQADAELARLSFALGWSKEIPALAMAALKENSSDGATRAFHARVSARDDNPPDISDLSVALARGGSGDPQMRVDVAAALLTRTDSKEASDQAFAVLNDLVHTELPPLEAVALWADAAERSDIDPAKLLSVLESGSARAPHRTQLLGELARVHEMLGDTGKARDYYNRIILVSDRPDERLWAQKQADSVRLQEK
jgi:hypothetical protein